MMRKILLAAIAFASVCGVAQAQKTPKVAVVDIPKVVSASTMAADQRGLLETDADAMRAWAVAQEKDLVALRNEVEMAKSQSESALLHDSGRVAAKANLENLARNFQARQEQYFRSRQDKETALNARQQMMTSNIVEEIRPVVEVIAKDKGVDLVLNSNVAGLSVLFSDKSLDITDDVIKRLNAAYVPRPKPAPAKDAAAKPDAAKTDAAKK